MSLYFSDFVKLYHHIPPRITALMRYDRVSLVEYFLRKIPFTICWNHVKSLLHLRWVIKLCHFCLLSTINGITLQHLPFCLHQRDIIIINDPSKSIAIFTVMILLIVLFRFSSKILIQAIIQLLLNYWLVCCVRDLFQFYNWVVSLYTC